MKLGITFFIVLILSGMLFFTLPLMRKWFKSIEIFLLFLFTSYFCQHMFYQISSPYDRLRVTEEHFSFWTVRLQYGVIFAISLMWLMTVYRSQSTLMSKLTTTFSWIIFGVLVEKIFLIIGVLHSNSSSWYPSLDMFFEMLVILFTLFFTNFINRTLMKDGII